MENIITRLDGEKVMKMISGLPEMYANILFMKYNEELSIGEIAKNLDVSQNVVSVRLNRALKQLKSLVESEIGKYEQ